MYQKVLIKSAANHKVISLFLWIRSMWQRIGAVRLFAEHVTSFAEKDKDVSSESVIRLWKVV